jgi:Tol biopolymer transport system component
MSNGQGADIWVKDLDRETASRLSFIGGDNRWPVWSPDGKNIVFRSTNQATPGLYWSRSDGVGEARRLTDGKLDEVPYSFSPDARWLAFQQNGNAGSRDIFTAPIEGDPGQLRLGKPELFLGTPFVEVYPAFSPDGRWLAYSSNESGTFEIYVRPFPGSGGQRQISIGGGRFPLWSRDGRQLFFQTTDQRVIVVDYSTTRDSFAVGKPRQWAKTLLMDTGAYSNYDLAPDGKRIAATVEKAEISSQKTTQLTVLLNFFDELRRRVPAGK